MSDPMTSFEIEDVLSSIRRLVSEDLRPTHKLVSAALQKGATKLILTPALRIVSDVRTALPEWDKAVDDAPDLETVLHEIVADESENAPDALPVFGSVRVLEQTERAKDIWQGDLEAATSDADFLTTAMSRINGLSTAGDKTEDQSQSDTIEAVVAAVGAAVGPEEWEVDGGEPAPQAKSWLEVAWNSDAVAPVPASERARDAALDKDAAAAGLDQESATETAIRTVQIEPDLTPDSSKNTGNFVGHDSIIFHDEASLAEDNAAHSAPDDAVAASDVDDASGFLSEDLLREIVRDMIKEELQGTLGERITRNVRKLVRSEINRALASRDFDEVASR